MPEEVASYIEKKYLELKEKAKTYRELEKLICRASREEGYRNHNWGSFFHVQLMEMLHMEWGSVPIIR